MPKGKHNNHKKGASHYRWNKGKILSTEGYVKIRVGKKHPLADPNGYAYEHLVNWVSAGNPLPKEDEIIHHDNEDRTDNRILNLKLLTRAQHNRLHNLSRLRDSSGQFLPKTAQPAANA